MMRPSDQDVLRLVHRAIDELNPQLPPDRRLEKAADSPVFGRAGRLDSLALVNLIVAIEQAIEDDFGVSVALADEKAVSQRSSPFRTVGSLAAYVRERVEEHARDG